MGNSPSEPLPRAPPPPPTPEPPPPPPPTAIMAADDGRQMALIIYILLLVPFSFGVTHIVGLVLAYLNRDTAPDWLRSHYTFQIHTFWLGLLYFAVACLSVIMIVGVVLVPAVIVWYIVRCALGLSRLMRSEAYPSPESWTI